MHAKEVCHRDLKPENILISTDNNDCVLKLADFGCAGPIEGWKEEGYPQTYCGTRAFMAPEVLRANKCIGSY